MTRTDCYINWDRLGYGVKVNGIDPFYMFNADLVEVTHGAGSIESSYQRQVGKSGMQVFSMDFEQGSMEMVFYVLGRSKEEAMRLASDFVLEASDSVIKIESDLNSEYDCVLDDYSVELTGVDWVLQVVLSFSCVRRLPKKAATAKGATSISLSNSGSIASGCRIEVKSSVARTNVSVAGITIKSLKANMPFIIDGFEGEVMENGINKILETDISEFPKVQPGKSAFTSNYALDWKVEWYPTFII